MLNGRKNTKIVVYLQEVYKIPKKEVLEERKRTEKELGELQLFKEAQCLKI